MITLYYAEPVLSGRVLDGNLFAVRVRVRVRSGTAPVRPDRFALPETVVGRERVLEPTVFLQRLFVHQYHWQLFIVVVVAAETARILSAEIVRQSLVRGAESRRRRHEHADDQHQAHRYRRRRANLLVLCTYTNVRDK